MQRTLSDIFSLGKEGEDITFWNDYHIFFNLYWLLPLLKDKKTYSSKSAMIMMQTTHYVRL